MAGATRICANLGAHDLAAAVVAGRVAWAGAGWTSRLGRDPTGEPAAALVTDGAHDALTAALDGGTTDVDVGAARVRAFGVTADDGVAVVGVDVTALHERSRAARLAEARLGEIATTLARIRHRLEETQALARVGSFEMDPATGSLWWSPEIFEMLDLPPDTPLDPTVMIRNLHPEDVDKVRSWFWSAPAEGERRAIEHRFLRPDGEVRHVRSVLSTGQGPDGRTLICGSSIDITAEREACAELARTRAAADAEARAHAHFLGGLSHDLRTPVTALIGLLDLAVAARDPAAAARDLRDASAAARKVLGVIDDLLDYARLEVEQIELEHREFDLRDAVEDAASAARDVGGRAIETWVDPTLARSRHGDPVRFCQLVRQLLAEASRTGPAGAVRLSVSPGDAPGDVQLRVDGDGDGAPAATTTGIGLALVRALAARLNGRVGVGAGSSRVLTASVNVPESSAAAGGSTDRPGGAAPTHAMKVLVVDDTELVRDVIARLLAESGHAVVAAGDGDEAIRAAADQAFDLVLMDLAMPGTDGLAAARRIRADARARRAPRVPIVALTAWPDDEAAALDAGMDDYLVKPIDAARLAQLCEDAATGRVAPPVDHDALLERVGGATRLAAEVAALFVEKRAELTTPVRTAIAQADVDAIERTAHGLRGALVMVAAGPAAAIASEIEEHAADAATCDGLLTRLEREIARAAAELRLYPA